MNIRRFATPLLALALTTLIATGAQAQTVIKTTPAAMKTTLAGYRGKVVVVNFWATWCGPCVAEFPSLVKLYSNYRGKGVEFVPLSADDPTDTAKVKAFLGKNNLQKGWISASEDLAGLLKTFEPTLNDTDSVAIPITYILDRSGKVVKKMVGGHEYADFEQAVKSALAKK